MSTPPRISIYDQIYAIYQKITGSETASSAKQDELQGTQGTGSSYDPPTGGSGVFGWLSGIYKEIKAGISVSYVIASDGVLLPADSLATTIAGSTATAITYTVTYLTFTYVKTFTYTAGSVSSISQWVKQQ
ncbi:hypothetical protein [Polynucleobacter sp.]|uniref:hypothetical protein n=1 Tax=Polynucleobacter sp. TaxID=2029855 RepID=UPI003F69E420